VVFRCFPERILPARLVQRFDGGHGRLETEPGIAVHVEYPPAPERPKEARRILLVVRGPASEAPGADVLDKVRRPGDMVCVCEPRGVGRTRWTCKNPPNYVERSHVLLGRTVDTGRVWDVIAVARHLHAEQGGKVPVHVVGEGAAGVLAAYAALWEPQIAGAMLKDPPLSHMDDGAPQLLNVLRVCDIPDVLGMLAPRPLTVWRDSDEALRKTAQAYAAAGEPERFTRESP